MADKERKRMKNSMISLGRDMFGVPQVYLAIGLASWIWMILSSCNF